MLAGTQNRTRKALSIFLVAGAALLAGTAQARDPYVGVTIGGAVVPGMYGQVTVSNGWSGPAYYAPRVVAPVAYVPAYVSYAPRYEARCERREYRGYGRHEGWGHGWDHDRGWRGHHGRWGDD